jgi:selenocysteine lyase/cysteine desulfurase
VVGAFSACSNVTGILTDTDAVTRLLKRHGALAVWDYAGGGPYLPIAMSPAPDCAKDAVVISPHKFPGGPGASGVTVIRDRVIRTNRPHRPGGGTVAFVSPWDHRYAASLAAREEGGTPNVVGDIRAALVILVKDAIGADAVLAHAETLRTRAIAAWSGVPGLDLLALPPGARALPILSFRVRGRSGAPIHHQLFVRMLSDVTGIQARGGCACAGPYAHRLLGLSEAESRRLDARLAAGEELEKPGWVRLNLSLMHDEADVARILRAVPDLVARAETLAPRFRADPATARFAPAS